MNSDVYIISVLFAKLVVSFEIIKYLKFGKSIKGNVNAICPVQYTTKNRFFNSL